jgi:hypothetical protein
MATFQPRGHWAYKREALNVVEVAVSGRRFDDTERMGDGVIGEQSVLLLQFQRDKKYWARMFSTARPPPSGLRTSSA